MQSADIHIRGLSQQFAGQEVLCDINAVAPAGQVTGLIGPNGGGKSTLLLLMAGLLEPSHGTVHIGEIASRELAWNAGGAVGLVTADPGLYPLLTGRENLHYFGGLYRLAPGEIDAKAAPLLDRLSLDKDIDRPVSTWSSGMRQKLSLVRALLLAPTALLLDEPTANLDPVAAWTIYEAVREQADRGVAVVLCTHDLHAAESLCEQVLLLERKILAVHAQDGDRRTPPVGKLLALYKSRVSP